MLATCLYAFILTTFMFSVHSLYAVQPTHTNLKEIVTLNTIKKSGSDDHESQKVFAPLDKIELRLIGKEQLPINLLTAVRIASVSNLEIAEAKMKVAEAIGNSNAATGGMFPSFSLFFGLGQTDGRVQGSFGVLRDVNFNTLNPGLIASYSLNPGNAIFNILAAHSTVDATKNDESNITQDVLLSVVEGYYDLLEAQGKVNIGEKAVSESMTLVKIAEILEKQGIGAGADVERAKAELAKQEQDLVRAQQQFRGNSADLALILKLDPSVTLFPTDNNIRKIQLVDKKSSLDDMIDSSLKNHPEISSAYNQRKAAGAKVSGAWLNALGPEILLAAEFGGIGDEFGNIGKREIYQGTVGITIAPSSYGKIKAARAKLRRAEIETERVKDSLITEIVKAFDDVISAEEEITFSLNQREAAEESLRLSQVRFKRGLGLAIEVIQAEDALSSARLNFIRSITEYNKSEIRLLNAIGEISAQNLIGAIQNVL